MQQVDKERLLVFAKTHLSDVLGKSLMMDVVTLETRQMDIHVEDVNSIMEAEDVMADPGSEMLRIVKHAVESLPPLDS